MLVVGLKTTGQHQQVFLVEEIIQLYIWARLFLTLLEYAKSTNDPTQYTGWSLGQIDNAAFLVGGVLVYMTA